MHAFYAPSIATFSAGIRAGQPFSVNSQAAVLTVLVIAMPEVLAVTQQILKHGFRIRAAPEKIPGLTS